MEHSRAVLPSGMAIPVVRWQLSLLDNEKWWDNSECFQAHCGSTPHCCVSSTEWRILTQLHLSPADVQEPKDDCKVVAALKMVLHFFSSSILHSFLLHIIANYLYYTRLWTRIWRYNSKHFLGLFYNAFDCIIILLHIILSLCGTTEGNVKSWSYQRSSIR